MPQISRADLAHVYEHSHGDFETLRGGRVLITGASGFVGSWLVETAAYANQTASAEIEILALVPPDLDPERHAANITALAGVSIVRGDIRSISSDELARQTGSDSLTAVVHAAVFVDAATLAANPMPTLETSVLGTFQTLRLARTCRARRFLFLSSGAIYGTVPSHITPIPESYLGGPDPTDPLAVYAEGKRIGEMMCACETRLGGLDTIIARAFAFVGPHLPIDRHFAIGNFIRDALRGGPIVVNGDGTPVRSYQYAADMAIWLWALLVRGQPGRAYNVGGAREMTVRGVAELVAGICTPKCEVDVRQRSVPGSVAHRYVPDTRLACETLGLRETVSLEEAIQRTVAWHRAQDDER